MKTSTILSALSLVFLSLPAISQAAAPKCYALQAGAAGDAASICLSYGEASRPEWIATTAELLSENGQLIERIPLEGKAVAAAATVFVSPKGQGSLYFVGLDQSLVFGAAPLSLYVRNLRTNTIQEAPALKRPTPPKPRPCGFGHPGHC